MAFSECKAYSQYCEIFCSKPCVTLTYSKPSIFRTLTYSEISHIENSAEYLRWSILLRTLCSYSRFRDPIYSKHSKWYVSYSLMYQLFFRTSNVLLYPLIKTWGSL